MAPAIKLPAHALQYERQLIALASETPRLTQAVIAARIGVSLPTAGSWLAILRRQGKIAPRYKRGAPMPPTFTQAYWIEAIGRGRSRGLTWERIGVQLGTSRQAVHQFWNHHTRHPAEPARSAAA